MPRWEDSEEEGDEERHADEEEAGRPKKKAMRSRVKKEQFGEPFYETDGRPGAARGTHAQVPKFLPHPPWRVRIPVLELVPWNYGLCPRCSAGRPYRAAWRHE